MLIHRVFGYFFLLTTMVPVIAQENGSVNVREQGTNFQEQEPIVEGESVPTYAEMEPLLISNTCIACHLVNHRILGPSFTEIAARKYSPELIVKLIYNPQPSNWPDIATPMAPMPQVPEDEARKIAIWINSLWEE